MKSLIKIVISVAIMLVAFGVSVSAADSGYVTADVLNVRQAPAMDSAVVGKIYNGGCVNVVGAVDVWYQIEFNGSYAYVHSDYIYKTEPYTGSQGSAAGQSVVETAKRYIGTPYVYGGMSPSGFDCSGFVKYVYAQHGVILNRVADDQAKNGYAVSRNEMVPGDILCFASNGGSGYISHVGIYVGNNQFIHSPRTGYAVTIESLTTTSYGKRIAAVRRIF